MRVLWEPFIRNLNQFQKLTKSLYRSSGELYIFTSYEQRHYKNMTLKQWEGLKELRDSTENGTIRISLSDKGEDLVVVLQIANIRTSTERLYRLYSSNRKGFDTFGSKSESQRDWMKGL